MLSIDGSQVLVVAMCGVTCSGKTTLTKAIVNHFKCESIQMDDYFLKEDDPRHVFVPEVNHFNWELPSSLDLDKMYTDACHMIERMEISGYKNRILILEGFLVLNDAKLRSLCQLKFFVDLKYDECLHRRKNRVYDPPDVPGYFEKVVWPESQKNKKAVLASVPDLHILDGTVPLLVNKANIITIINKFRLL